MTIVKGGHAVMLDIELPAEMIRVRDEWVAKRPDQRSMIEHTHLTLAFVGRDMPIETLQKMVVASHTAIDHLPESLTFEGNYAIFGGRRDHLVALVLRSPELNNARNKLIDELLKFGVDINSDFGFNPHVSLAKSAVGNQYAPFVNAKRTLIDVGNIVVKAGDTRHEVPRAYER